MRPGPIGPGRYHRRNFPIFLLSDILLIAPRQVADVTRYAGWTEYAEAQSCIREEPISKVARSKIALSSYYTGIVQKNLTIKVSLEGGLVPSRETRV